MKKKAVIRGNQVRSCPFGLSIPCACKHAGMSVNRMAPLQYVDENRMQSVIKANRLVYAYHRPCKKCPYADKIVKDLQKVDCDFGDTGEGMNSTSFVGSPLYPQTFGGVGADGLHGYPLGFYADNNESRNLFFGIFSLLGFNTMEEIVKLADIYDKCGEHEKANLVDNLLERLKLIKEEYTKVFEKIEKYLADYRKQYENKRSDTGLLWDLSRKWYEPRNR